MLMWSVSENSSKPICNQAKFRKTELKEWKVDLFGSKSPYECEMRLFECEMHTQINEYVGYKDKVCCPYDFVSE